MNLETRNSELLIAEILDEIRKEVTRAVRMFAAMNSPHEAEAVIREEFDEYWEEVKKHNTFKKRDTRPRQREELIQLAAMAVRAIHDTIDNPERQEHVDRLKIAINNGGHTLHRVSDEIPTPNIDEAGKFGD